MKKQKATALPKTFAPSVFEQPTPDLPSRDAVLKTIVEISQPTPPLIADKPKKGRVKLTTAVSPDLLEWVKIHAVKTGLSVADILHMALIEYKRSYE